MAFLLLYSTIQKSETTFIYLIYSQNGHEVFHFSAESMFNKITQKPRQLNIISYFSVFAVSTLYLYYSFHSFHDIHFQFLKDICRDISPHLTSSNVEVWPLGWSVHCSQKVSRFRSEELRLGQGG